MTGTPANEVSASGTAYTRQPLVGAFAADNTTRTATSTGDITWTTATGSGFGTVSHIGIMNTGTINTAAGSCLFHLDITDVLVSAGDQAKITAGNLTITLN